MTIFRSLKIKRYYVITKFLSWKRKKYALAKLAVIAVFLFLFGLLPWVDNYAHLFGFISGTLISSLKIRGNSWNSKCNSGILLSFALLPYIVFGEFDHGRKFYQAIFAIMIWLALMITLIVLFYNPNPLYLEWAHRFTCVPPIGEAEGKARYCPKYSDELSQNFKIFSCHLESFYSDLASMTINYKTITIL